MYFSIRYKKENFDFFLKRFKKNIDRKFLFKKNKIEKIKILKKIL